MNVPQYDERDNKLWVLLCQIRDNLYKLRADELSKYKLTVVEAGVLFVIRLMGDSATPSEIAKVTIRQHQTITALLKRMEKKDLIARFQDPNKKNSWRVRLTEKGINAYSQSIKWNSIQAVMCVLSEDEKERLEEYLRKLRDQTIKNEISLQLSVFP